MHETSKMALALGLVLTMLSITYLATPALAFVDGTGNREKELRDLGYDAKLS